MSLNDTQTVNTEGNDAGAVAIIGMNGRFPGAKNTAEFWENLKNGVESVKFFSREELLTMGIDEYLLDNPKFVAADAIMDDMDQFDASFFDYSAREAEIMDPQHRHFLESAWEVLESAGYNSDLYHGRIAVYAGSALSGYMIRNLNPHPELIQNVGTFKIMIANSQDFLATRVSYKLNLTGPSINVNTLCSSSMVALHMACQNLLSFNCDLALAGGVSFQISRNEAFFYQEGGIGASDGHCRAFDARANGTVSGSGLGVVVLKRLEDALADGDYIHAVIRGSAVNNDGASKNSFTAPNVDGQAECIAEALAMSEVDPETISYVEAHGTGTNLGDPIEIAALTKAFRSYTSKKKFCAVGSVKTNIGHLVTAGGIASLMKTVLAMEHHLLPPSLNFEIPNPKIDFENSPFFVQTQLSNWESQGTPLRAGVSSFGIGGTNVHVIVEEAPEMPHSPKSNRPWQLIVFSAKTEAALERMTQNLLEHCQKNPDLDLADVAFTLQVGRRSFNHRRMLVCRDLPDFIAKLQARRPNEVYTHFYKPKEPEVGFVFSGMDSAYLNMGRELYQTEPLFRREVDRCSDILRPMLPHDLRSFMAPESSQTEKAKEWFDHPGTQRALTFTVEYALAKMWLDWGVAPGFMTGRDVGEYVAACLAEVFSLEDALALVASEQEILPAKLESISFREPVLPLISSVTGTRLTGSEAIDPGYWRRSQSLTATSEKALQEIGQDPDRIIIAIGPDRVSNDLMKKLFPQGGSVVITTLPGGDETKSEAYTLFSGLGQFWLAGGPVNWFQLSAAEKRRRVPLPTYPFERQRYWIDPPQRQSSQVEVAKAAAGLNPETVQASKKPRPNLATPYTAPSNETERIIVDCWQNVLGFDQIGIRDDFFELGGHSLLAAAVANELSRTFQIQIPLGNIFETSTVTEIAELIDNYRWAARKTSATSDEGGPESGIEEGVL